MPDKPSIILIVADDMVYGDCSGFGSKTIRTPNIDAMAGIDMSDDLLLDGTDIMPIMSGRAAPPERGLFWRAKEQRAVRSGKWKLALELTEKIAAWGAEVSRKEELT